MSHWVISHWAMWGVAALALGLVELTAPGYYLIWIAAGGLVAALYAATGDTSFTTELVVFAVAAAILLLRQSRGFHRHQIATYCHAIVSVKRKRKRPVKYKPRPLTAPRGPGLEILS